MNTTASSNSVTELATDDLEKELDRRKFQQYPADIKAIADSVRERAEFYKIKPRRLLEDLGKQFQVKKFVSLANAGNEKVAS